MEYRTIRDILTNAEKCFGNEDAIRYKTGKNEIAAKTYTQLKEDSERITALLKKLGDPKSHIALIGATSYLWIPILELWTAEMLQYRWMCHFRQKNCVNLSTVQM